MAVFAVGVLPDDALAAAAEFYARVLPHIAPGPEEHLILAFSPADDSHRAWRLAAVQGLARRHAPLRVNGFESADQTALAAASAYLDSAPGVTGQFWPLDAAGVKGA